MGKVRIVTDSSAQFLDQSVVARYEITIVPLEIRLGLRTYREGVDLDAEGFFRRMEESDQVPTLLPPTLDRLAEAYTRLGRETDRILSLHLSRAIHSTWQQARDASKTVLGRTEIVVLDSQTASVGLAFLAEEAARMAEETDSIGDIVRHIRSVIPRIYSLFYVESMEYPRRFGLVSESQAILGTMLGVKPFLTIEEGELSAIEKVRTRSQALDKLVEFVSEFSDVERLVILQSTPYTTEQTRTLQDRLTAEVPTPGIRTFPVTMYNPSLACLLGPDAMGIVILEGEQEDPDDFAEDEFS